MLCRAAAVAVAIASRAIPAYADRATADHLAADANALASAGDLAGAALKFRAAFAADPRPELTCNIGVAYFKLGDLPRAQRYLQECVLTGGKLDVAFLARVRTTLANVENTLAVGDVTPIDLDAEPTTATIDVDAWPGEPLAGPHRIWLAYGHHEIVVHAPGFVAQTIEVDANSHNTETRRIVLEREPAVVASTRVPPPPAPAPVGPPRLAEVMLAGAGVFAVTGVALHVGAVHVRGELASAQTGAEWDQHASTFETLRIAAIAGYALAAVAGGIGGYLLYRHGRERGPTIDVAIAPGGASLAVEWHR